MIILKKGLRSYTFTLIVTIIVIIEIFDGGNHDMLFYGDKHHHNFRFCIYSLFHKAIYFIL